MLLWTCCGWNTATSAGRRARFHTNQPSSTSTIDYLAKVNATIHLNHKPGEVMQVDWAGDTAAAIDTDTGEIIPAYVFVATLPYSGYSYVEAFFSMNQEACPQPM